MNKKKPTLYLIWVRQNGEKCIRRKMLFKKNKDVEEPEEELDEDAIRGIIRHELGIFYSNQIVPCIRQCVANEVQHIFTEDMEATLEERVLLKIMKKALIQIKEGE